MNAMKESGLTIKLKKEFAFIYATKAFVLTKMIQAKTQILVLCNMDINSLHNINK
jgi:hypothetical protein